MRRGASMPTCVDWSLHFCLVWGADHGAPSRKLAALCGMFLFGLGQEGLRPLAWSCSSQAVVACGAALFALTRLRTRCAPGFSLSQWVPGGVGDLLRGHGALLRALSRRRPVLCGGKVRCMLTRTLTNSRPASTSPSWPWRLDHRAHLPHPRHMNWWGCCPRRSSRPTATASAP